jgi:hypothetical protein
VVHEVLESTVVLVALVGEALVDEIPQLTSLLDVILEQCPESFAWDFSTRRVV